MSATESVRVRLEFEDRRILSKSQRKAGLKRSWMVLKPQHRTVSDLASHLLHAFGLQESCPHGLILSMDGFVLPPFESSSVFKDKDVVWVKRKEQSSIGTTRLCGEKNSRKALEILDKQPVKGNLLLLANEDFIKETGGYESESEDDEDEDEPSADTNNIENAAYTDVDSKKRKASKKLKSPKRKKSRLTNAEESPGACGGAKNEEPAAKKGNLQDRKISLKDSQVKKDKSSQIKGKKDMASISKKDTEVSGNEELAAKKKAKKSSAACGDAGNGEPLTKTEDPQDDKALLKDNQLEKVKSSHSKGKNDVARTSKNDKEVYALSLSSPEVKGKGIVDASPTPSEAKKLPSRSARRKKLKRQWLREMRKIGNTEEGQRRQSSGGDDWRKKFLGDNVLTFGSQDENRKSEEHQQHPQSHVVAAVTGNQQPHHDNSSKDVTVPIEIRPGHIRFEPLDEDAAQPTQKSPVPPVTTFQWNGVTDKKKGQKWGREKGATKWTESGYQKTKWTENSYQKSKWTDNNKQKTWTGSNYQNADNNGQNGAWNGSQNLHQEPSREASQEKEAHQSDSMDFSKLSPYGPVPQEGDIVAYRVIELSSSWTPEVSPFRVGKISSCKQASKKITLLPVPEHPFDLEKVDKALYGEDGSLEVDFTSLVDARTFSGKSGSAQAVGGEGNETTAGDSDAAGAQGNNNDEVNPAPAKENGGPNAWEEITQALSAKKSELSQEDRWKRKENPAKGPPSSSYRGMRRSALGPIMALLRAQNAMV